MVEIVGLASIADGAVTDDVLVAAYDTVAPSAQTKKMTVGQILDTAMRTTGTTEAQIVVVTVGISAPAAEFDEVAINTSLDMGSQLTRILRLSASATIPTAASGVGVSVIVAMPNVAIGDAVSVHMPLGFPAGLILNAIATVTNQVTVYAFNATASSIASAAYTLQLVALRFA